MKKVRQGDVMFVDGASIPKGATKRANGTVAYGEVTGHAHTVMTAETAEVLEVGDGVFVRVSDRGLAIEADAARLTPDLRAVIGDEGETAQRKAAAKKLLDIRPIAGAIFVHGTAEERAARPVPATGEDRRLRPGPPGQQ